jgi:hypothetical protein
MKSMRQMDVTAHELVARTAEGMAQEVYEEMCSGSNAMYKVNANRRDFIKKAAPQLRQSARIVLASMLNDLSITDKDRDIIHEALVLDNMLPKEGTSVAHKGWQH